MGSYPAIFLETGGLVTNEDIDFCATDPSKSKKVSQYVYFQLFDRIDKSSFGPALCDRSCVISAKNRILIA
jgi:hypothetical protein